MASQYIEINYNALAFDLSVWNRFNYQMIENWMTLIGCWIVLHV